MMCGDLRRVALTGGREAELRKMLDERRWELMHDLQQGVQQVRSRAASFDATEVVDAAETAEADIQDDLHFALMQLKAETLERVEEAMTRLGSGRFGLCVECDGEIAERRLRALPFALRCTECEEVRENEARRLEKAPRRFPGAMFDAH